MILMSANFALALNSGAIATQSHDKSISRLLEKSSNRAIGPERARLGGRYRGRDLAASRAGAAGAACGLAAGRTVRCAPRASAYPAPPGAAWRHLTPDDATWGGA